MTNKYVSEVETKGLISRKDYVGIDELLTNHPEVTLKARFGLKTDLFWDVGSDSVEAFVRCRFDEDRSNPGWLIKVQQGGFNNRIEIDLPVKDMCRYYDYKITGDGSVWYHGPTRCAISLYYVVELKQHFIEIESEERNMDHVYHCERALDIGRFEVQDVQTSLFSMIKTKKLTKR